MNESCHKCPNCGNVTFGVKSSSIKLKPIICPVCSRNGLTVIMVESQENDKQYMGDGLFSRKKPLTENKKLLNEGM